MAIPRNCTSGVILFISAIGLCLHACNQISEDRVVSKAPVESVSQTVVTKKSSLPGEAAMPDMPGDENIFIRLAKKVVPSVVNISTATTIKAPYSRRGPEDMFRKFFEEFMGPGFRFDFEDTPESPDGGRNGNGRRGGPRGPQPKNLPKAMSLGTGFIIDSSGLILTNNHVVEGADEIKISFTEASDERPTDGEVVGRDPEMDVALIRVKSKRQMNPLAFGDSDSIQVGAYVLAVGNPFGQGHSVTHGIISAKGRSAPEFPLATYLQTDAPINPGNSGGPLVNLKGEVIGINNAIDVRAQGIGFAIPINSVKQNLGQLKDKGRVERGYIGILAADLSSSIAEKIGASKDLQAPFVTSVTPGDPAEKAGIKPYDVILEVNGIPVHSSSELVKSITAVKVGDVAQVKILRDGKEQKVKVKVAKRPGAKEPKGAPKKKPVRPSKSIDTGMDLETLTPEISKQLGITDKTRGVVVTGLDYGSPADRAGLSRGDVIVEVDKKPVKDAEAFYSIVKDKKSYMLRVRKGGGLSTGDSAFVVVVLDLSESNDVTNGLENRSNEP